jgi:hypothetical protein
MTERGFDLRTYYGTDKAELPLSATYVVDRNGKIIYAFLDPDYKLRAESADIVAALKKNKKEGFQPPEVVRDNGIMKSLPKCDW